MDRWVYRQTTEIIQYTWCCLFIFTQWKNCDCISKICICFSPMKQISFTDLLHRENCVIHPIKLLQKYCLQAELKWQKFEKSKKWLELLKMYAAVLQTCLVSLVFAKAISLIFIIFKEGSSLSFCTIVVVCFSLQDWLMQCWLLFLLSRGCTLLLFPFLFIC